MVKRILAWIGAIVVVGAILVPCGAQELPFTHFTPRSGPVTLPSSSVQKVYQDSSGYIWLGFFSSGLARYNGHSLTMYSVEDGLGDLTVRDFVEDGSGRLWVASETGVYATELPMKYVPPDRRLRFSSEFAGVSLPTERMGRNQMATLPDGRLAIATRKGVATYQFDHTGTLYRSLIRSDDGGGGASVLTVGESGTLWVAFENGSFGRQPYGMKTIKTWRDSALSGTTVSALLEYGGQLWLGTVSGEVWKLSREGKFEQVSNVLTERVSALSAGDSGEIWVASLGSGIMPLDPMEDIERGVFTRENGLLGDTVWSILVDREGSTWFAQNGGLSRLRSDYAAFTALSGASHRGETPVLPAPECFAVVAPASKEGSGADSLTWIATGAGLAVRNSEGDVVTLGHEDGLLSGSVYSLARDDAGRVWVGTANGLNAVFFGEGTSGGLTTESPVEIFGLEGSVVSFWALESERVYSSRIVRVPDGESTLEVVFTAGSSGVTCLVEGEWLRLFGEDAATAAYDVAIDSYGHLWAATPQRGVMRTPQPVSVTTLSKWSEDGVPDVGVFKSVWNRESGSPSNHFRSLAVTESRVFAGAAGGVASFHLCANGTVLEKEFLSRHDGIDDGIAASMIVGPEGAVWLSQSSGVLELDPDSMKVRRRLTTREGLIDNEVWGPEALAIGVDGRLYVATPRGVSIVEVDALEMNRKPPPVRIERFDFNRGRGSTWDVDFEFAALSFRNEDGVRFRTRLIGYVDDWSDPTAEPTIRYPGLPKGEAFIFEVLASNEAGVWTEEPERYEFVLGKGR